MSPLLFCKGFKNPDSISRRHSAQRACGGRAGFLLGFETLKQEVRYPRIT